MASCLPACVYQPVCPLFKPPLYESLMDSPSPLQFPLNVRPSRPYCRPTSPSAQLLPPPDMTDNISDTPAIPSSRGPPSVGTSSRTRDATHPGTEFTDTLAHQVGRPALSAVLRMGKKNAQAIVTKQERGPRLAAFDQKHFLLETSSIPLLSTVSSCVQTSAIKLLHIDRHMFASRSSCTLNGKQSQRLSGHG